MQMGFYGYNTYGNSKSRVLIHKTVNLHGNTQTFNPFSKKYNKKEEVWKFGTPNLPVYIKNFVVIHCFVNIYGSVKIGKNVTIGAHAHIENGVSIGDDCKIQSYVNLVPGTWLGRGVFVGPHTTFTNDRYPQATVLENGNRRLTTREDWKFEPVRVEDYASIGAGCVILPGVTIGAGAMVGAGSVVVENVPAGEVWAGNPARFLYPFSSSVESLHEA
jgi:acetyltransferase-like isoleucine patch superfamily enzyme